LETLSDSVELAAGPDDVWALIGQFRGKGHPLVAKIEVRGSGIRQTRIVDMVNGMQVTGCRIDALATSASAGFVLHGCSPNCLWRWMAESIFPNGLSSQARSNQFQ